MVIVLIQCVKGVLALSGHARVYINVDAVHESPNKPGIPSPREEVLRLVKSWLIYAILSYVSVSRIIPKLTSKLSLNLWHLTLCPIAIQEAKEAITLRRSLSRMRTWGDGQLVIDSLSQKLVGCKASQSVFCPVVAHNTTQVLVYLYLSAGYSWIRCGVVIRKSFGVP